MNPYKVNYKYGTKGIARFCEVWGDDAMLWTKAQNQLEGYELTGERKIYYEFREGHGWCLHFEKVIN